MLEGVEDVQAMLVGVRATSAVMQAGAHADDVSEVRKTSSAGSRALADARTTLDCERAGRRAAEVGVVRATFEAHGLPRPKRPGDIMGEEGARRSVRLRENVELMRRQLHALACCHRTRHCPRPDQQHSQVQLLSTIEYQV